VIRRILSAAAVIAACIAAVVLTGASSEDPQGKSYKVELDNAFGLTEGGDFRIGGVKAGKTTGFSISEGEPAKAIVEFTISEPGFDSLRTDARCEVRQQSLIGEYYVDCQPGSDEELLPEGGTVPVEQTASIIPADLVNNVLREPYRDRLRLIIAELGTGLAGRPQDLAETIRRAHPGLRETSRTLGILKDQTKIIQNFVTDSDTVVAELAQNKADVARFVTEAGETAEISATRRAELAEQFEKFPTFLRELDPTMARLGELADAQIPLLGDLRAASGDLERFFTELGPFADAALPSIRSLGNAGDVGRRAFNESADEIDQLRQVARGACGKESNIGECPRLATPLRQFLVSLDDRGRASEADPRAAETAPPPPDPTSKKPGRGFTGMEALMDYLFWQTLAINGFDDISHFLRFLGIESPCSPYAVDPERDLIEQCNAYLGPSQPGVEQATGNINGQNFGGAEGRNPGGSGSSSASTQGATADTKRAAGASSKLPAGFGDGGSEAPSPTPSAPQSGGAPDQLLDFLLGP
jgi:ABC-type transporter Mla subunit MlaD